jgi:hypothetical protein
MAYHGMGPPLGRTDAGTLQLQASLVATMGSYSLPGRIFGAFLTAWPIIVYWDLLSNPVVAHLKPIFFVLYVLYMFGYGYMALLGFLGTIFLREQLGRPDGEKKLVSLPELSRVGVLWILNSGIASAAMEVITK